MAHAPHAMDQEPYKVHRHSFPASLQCCEAVSMRIYYLVFGLLLLCLVPAPGKLGWGLRVARVEGMPIRAGPSSFLSLL